MDFPIRYYVLKNCVFIKKHKTNKVYCGNNFYIYPIKNSPYEKHHTTAQYSTLQYSRGFTKTLFILILVISFLKPEWSKAQCTHPDIVGSNVGISTLSDAVSTLGWVITSDVLQGYDFCVDGTFTSDYTLFSTITIQDCNIQLLSNASILFDSNAGFINFILDQCVVQGDLNTNITFTGGSNQISNSSFISITAANFFGGFYIIENGCIITSTPCTFNWTTSNLLNSNFDDSPLLFNPSLGYISSSNNVFNRINAGMNQPAVTLDQVSYFGEGNEYNDFETSILNIGASFVSETGSIFSANGNGSSIFRSEGPARIILDDNDFIEQNNHAIRIANNNESTEIVNNRFITSQSGLRDAAFLITSNNLKVENNTYNGILPINQNPSSSTFWITGCVDLLVNYNESFTGFNAFGTRLVLSDNTGMFGNHFDSNHHGISTLSSSESYIVSNHLESNSIAGLQVSNCNNSFYDCNNLLVNRDGLNASNTNPNVFFRNNQIGRNGRGLVYQPGTTAPQHINMGNTFFQNALGAEFEGNPSLSDISLMQYFYDMTVPGNNEFPGTVIPLGWFQGNRDPSYTCPLPLPGGEGEKERAANLEHALFLITCAGEEMTNGRCFYNLKQVIQLIESEVYLLEHDSIQEFYEVYGNSTLALLPDPIEIVRVIVQSIEGIPAFPHPADPLNPTPEEIAAIEAFANAFNDIVAIHQEDKNVRIANLYTYLNGLDIDGHFESRYLQSIEWLISVLLGNEIEDLPLDEILDLAESCLEFEGPAVFIAQGILSSQRLPFEENNLCFEESELSATPNITQSEVIEIYPNPVTTILNVPSFQESTINVWHIMDINGRVVQKSIDIGDGILNVQKLTPGLYILKAIDRNYQSKFIKL